MKKTIFILFIFSFMVNLAFGQSASATHTSCNSIKVVVTPGVVSDLYYPGECVCCDSGHPKACGESCTFDHVLAYGHVYGAMYTLQEKISGIYYNVGDPIDSDFPTKTYGNLPTGRVFRVRVLLRGTDGTPVYGYDNPCFPTPIGRMYVWGSGTTVYTPDIEIGVPVPAGALFDGSGTPANNVFCTNDITNFLLFSGATSFAEVNWWVDICKIGTGGSGCSQWNYTNWQTGQVGFVDLLNQVWRLGHPDWSFTPGQYRMTLALAQNPCEDWVSMSIPFTVVNGGCRRAAQQSPPILVFPNPANNTIQFHGLEMWKSEDLFFKILDINGRTVTEDYLPSRALPIDVSSLNDGLYVIQIKGGENFSTQKFSVVH